jgi:hypothetical protein
MSCSFYSFAGSEDALFSLKQIDEKLKELREGLDYGGWTMTIKIRQPEDLLEEVIFVRKSKSNDPPTITHQTGIIYDFEITYFVYETVKDDEMKYKRIQRPVPHGHEMDYGVIESIEKLKIGLSTWFSRMSLYDGYQYELEIETSLSKTTMILTEPDFGRGMAPIKVWIDAVRYIKHNDDIPDIVESNPEFFLSPEELNQINLWKKMEESN